MDPLAQASQFGPFGGDPRVDERTRHRRAIVATAAPAPGPTAGLGGPSYHAAGAAAYREPSHRHGPRDAPQGVAPAVFGALLACRLAMAAPPVAPEGPPLRTAGESFRDCPDCPEMVVVPAGEFTMGSAQDEPGRGPHEGPQHRVRFAKPFAVGRYEVTFAEWDACVAAGGCRYKPRDHGGRERQPVVNVGWNDVHSYLAWLSAHTGHAYRLLTEAEWEYATRAGSGTRYPWGDMPDPRHANAGDTAGEPGTIGAAPVGSYPANAFGLYDLIGNVWEWVQDCWSDGYQGAPADGSAWTIGDCERRVMRGGSWNLNPGYARAAFRYWNRTDFRNIALGFRLARTI